MPADHAISGHFRGCFIFNLPEARPHFPQQILMVTTCLGTADPLRHLEDLANVKFAEKDAHGGKLREVVAAVHTFLTHTVFERKTTNNKYQTTNIKQQISNNKQQISSSTTNNKQLYLSNIINNKS